MIHRGSRPLSVFRAGEEVTPESLPDLVLTWQLGPSADRRGILTGRAAQRMAISRYALQLALLRTVEW